MNRASAIRLLDRLHDAQGKFYAGGDGGALERLLATNISWTVPGNSAIAGTHRGREEVFAYFRRRRELAGYSFQMTRRDVLVGDGQQIAALTDGSARIRGGDCRWSTVGLYEVIGEQIAACWLLPLDPLEFDAIWSG